MLDGTTESPPEVPHKSRRTLMSPQDCQIAQCSPNQLEMTTNSPALASEQCPISPSYRTIDLASFGKLQTFAETPVSSLQEHQFQHRNSMKASCTPYHLRREQIARILLKKLATSPQAPQEEPSLSNRYVRGTLNLLRHVQWIPRLPDSKGSLISLQWLECMLVFHLTI